ncbi:mitochondrial cation transporter [Microthyrium microscopicum]|uniref:Sidoreflexin n=1 Tax=Microthyrium microscopicum TaxID=703497 RepID=A0A6A6UQ65_9PEZI|nr:mitochondrial cation transporter [Microthyrium microscopicum]
MSSSLPGARPLPESRYDLSTYLGRVRHAAAIADMRTLFTSAQTLEQSKQILTQYKSGQIKEMNEDLWQAKKIVDSTLHPDTGQPVLLPFRMSAFVLTNLVVTAGMLTPNLRTRGTLFWQITNQSLNVAINTSNANKSHPLSTQKLLTSYALAVSASCSVALGLNALVPRLKRISPATRIVLGRLVPFAAVASAGVLNVFLMRAEEIRHGIDVFAAGDDGKEVLGQSRRAATIAVGETALSRVINATPIMVLPPLVLLRLQKTKLLAARPGLTLPVNLALILGVSVFALPIALGVFPARERVSARWVEEEFREKVGNDGEVEFNRGL